MLQHKRALQIAGAVKARRQAEVAFEKRTRSLESFDDISGVHGVHRNRLVYIVTMRTILFFVLCLPTIAAAQLPSPSGQTASVRRLTVDEAVQTALENNLGVQVARIDPAIHDLDVAGARAAWFPSFTTTLQGASTDTPSNSFLSGAQGPKTSDDRVNTNVGVGQALPWGGTYNIGWDSSRSTTTNIFSNFSPQLRSSLSINYTQPLLRGFSIDTPRQQLLISQKNREIADVTLRQSIAQTSRAVQRAYWDLAYAVAILNVERQSLDLAEESLRNTRARVEIGTTPPIDIVEAEAEVAQREEAVIVAEAQIETVEDTLRALIYNPTAADFWTVKLEPAERPQLTPVVVGVTAAVRNALDRRTDLQE